MAWQATCSITGMRNLLGDLRFASRTLAKSPGFAVIAILSIGLGIGANTAMFSYVDGLLLRPLPVKNAGAVISLRATSPGEPLGNVSYPDYADLRDRAKTMENIVSFSMFPAGIAPTREALPHMTVGYLVSGNFFSGLGIEPAAGRTFRPDEDRLGAPLVAVIGHGFWERDFNSDPNVAGRTLRLNNAEFTIIGVAPAEFTGPEPCCINIALTWFCACSNCRLENAMLPARRA